jgi:hypothetical protein
MAALRRAATLALLLLACLARCGDAAAATGAVRGARRALLVRCAPHAVWLAVQRRSAGRDQAAPRAA